MMADNGGFPLDFTQQIVNVQWAGGLAVEFGDKDKDAPKPDDNTA
jgi:hypothetical protein